MTNSDLVNESYWVEPEDSYIVEKDYLADETNCEQLLRKGFAKTTHQGLRTLARDYFIQGCKNLDKDRQIGGNLRQILTRSVLPSVALCFVLCASTVRVEAETDNIVSKNELKSANYDADNSGKNIRDRNNKTHTAQDQALVRDNDILAEIRKKLTDQAELSTNAKNVKIMVKDNTVILRGPVDSIDESEWIESTVRNTTSDEYTISNQIEVSPG